MSLSFDVPTFHPRPDNVKQMHVVSSLEFFVSCLQLILNMFSHNLLILFVFCSFPTHVMAICSYIIHPNQCSLHHDQCLLSTCYIYESKPNCPPIRCVLNQQRQLCHPNECQMINSESTLMLTNETTPHNTTTTTTPVSSYNPTVPVYRKDWFVVMIGSVLLLFSLILITINCCFHLCTKPVETPLNTVVIDDKSNANRKCPTKIHVNEPSNIKNVNSSAFKTENSQICLSRLDQRMTENQTETVASSTQAIERNQCSRI